MSSSHKESEEPSSTSASAERKASGSGGAGASAAAAAAAAAPARPPAKRPLSTHTVIEISDTESDDSDVCAVNSYQATADEVKRIRGTEYSSTSSSSDYSSDSDSPWEDDSILIEDKVQTKVVKTQLNPRAHRMDDPKFNPMLMSQEIKAKLKSHWMEKKDYISDDVSLTCDPFRVCLLHELLANSEIINNIVDDMNTLDWLRKKMDLYEFHQTTDLANLTWQRSIRGIYDLLKTEVMSWVSEVTGLQLTSVSASCSLYGPGDHLLVHDDLLADRRVAFILYLAPHGPPARLAVSDGSPAADLTNGDKRPSGRTVGWGGWHESMGGALELLSRDERGWAAHVVRSICPRNNTLAFFKVGHDSYHQVGEVLSLELPRLSINGWFHGPQPRPGSPCSAPLPPSPPAVVVAHTEVVLLSQWVDAAYMSPRVRGQVQEQMERASEVCLQDVLLPHRYEELLDALRHPDVEWEEVGPAQQRKYRRVSAQWAREQPGVIRDLLQLVSSTAFLRLLADCTDLQLTAYSRLELQQWRPGDYTLLPGREEYGHARLEALLYCGAEGAAAASAAAAGARRARGGATTYVCVEEADEAALLTVPPQSNALSLVYCDAGAAAFTKYYARLPAAQAARAHRPAHSDRFYLLSCAYTE